LFLQKIIYYRDYFILLVIVDWAKLFMHFKKFLISLWLFWNHMIAYINGIIRHLFIMLNVICLGILFTFEIIFFENSSIWRASLMLRDHMLIYAYDLIFLNLLIFPPTFLLYGIICRIVYAISKIFII
jgi:hypothetical protein